MIELSIAVLRSIAASVASASKRSWTTIGTPASSSRTAVSGPLWYSGPTTRCGPSLASRWDVMCSTKPARSGDVADRLRRQLDRLRSPGRARREQQVGQRPRWSARSSIGGAGPDELVELRPGDAVVGQLDDHATSRTGERRRGRRPRVVESTNASRAPDSPAMYEISPGVRWKLTGTEAASPSAAAAWATSVDGRLRAMTSSRRSSPRSNARIASASRSVASATSAHVAPPWASDRIAQPSGSAAARSSSGEARSSGEHGARR